MKKNPAPTRKATKRESIIAVAKELFFKNGFAATSMAQISEGVGGSKATLYSHFESKDELLIAVVEDILKPINVSVTSAPPPGDFRTWLAWLGQMGLKRILTDDFIAVRRIACAEASRFPQFGKAFYEKGVLPSFVPVAAVFQQAMEQGILRRSNPTEAAMMFIELCSGWMLRRVDWNISPKPGDAEIDAAVASAISVFMDGYRANDQGREIPNSNSTTS